MYVAYINGKKTLIAVCLAIAGIIATLTLSFTNASAVFYGGNLRKLPIYSVKTDEKIIHYDGDTSLHILVGKISRIS